MNGSERVGTSGLSGSVPVATTLSLVDRTPRAGCVRLRTAPVDVSLLQPGSCADESRCLEAGELDFADFCASS